MIDTALASQLAALPLAHLRRELPHKLDHLVLADADIGMRPRELHPAFYGCYDWHSAVHGHWLLARLVHEFPSAPFVADARKALASNITPARMAGEIDPRIGIQDMPHIDVT